MWAPGYFQIDIAHSVVACYPAAAFVTYLQDGSYKTTRIESITAMRCSLDGRLCSFVTYLQAGSYALLSRWKALFFCNIFASWVLQNHTPWAYYGDALLSRWKALFLCNRFARLVSQKPHALSSLQRRVALGFDALFFCNRALNETQRELRASVALVQKPPMYWSSAFTATAYSQFDVTAEMRTRMQAVVDKSCTVFGVRLYFVNPSCKYFTKTAAALGHHGTGPPRHLGHRATCGWQHGAAASAYKRIAPTTSNASSCHCVRLYFVNPSCKYFTPIQTHRSDQSTESPIFDASFW